MAPWFAWLRKHRVLGQAGSFYALLLGPGLLGLLLGMAHPSETGVCVGVFCATIYLVKAMAVRYEALAPSIPEGNEGSEDDGVEF